MSESERIEVAREYVDAQIQTMKAHGAVIPQERYEEMIAKVAKAVLCK